MGNYSVLYFGSSLEVCFGETLARFRPDPILAELVTEDWAELGFLPPGEIAADWRRSRLAVRARPANDRAVFLDVESLATRSTLVRLLARDLVGLGVSDLDVPTIRGGDRRVTRLISYWAHVQLNEDSTYRYAGLRYLSRLSTEWECWGFFDRTPTEELERRTIRADTPELRKVAKAFNLQVF